MQPSRARDLIELILGYGMIVGVIWTPEHWQRFLYPIVLLATLMVHLIGGLIDEIEAARLLSC